MRTCSQLMCSVCKRLIFLRLGTCIIEVREGLDRFIVHLDLQR